MSESRKVQHASDCAVHNEPALPRGKCDCGANRPTRRRAHTWTIRGCARRTFKGCIVADPSLCAFHGKEQLMYDVEQVRDTLMEAAQGSRPNDDWLRSIEGASPIDGADGAFGLTVNGQDFFVTVEAA